MKIDYPCLSINLFVNLHKNLIFTGSWIWRTELLVESTLRSSHRNFRSFSGPNNNGVIQNSEKISTGEKISCPFVATVLNVFNDKRWMTITHVINRNFSWCSWNKTKMKVLINRKKRKFPYNRQDQQAKAKICDKLNQKQILIDVWREFIVFIWTF